MRSQGCGEGNNVHAGGAAGSQDNAPHPWYHANLGWPPALCSRMLKRRAVGFPCKYSGIQAFTVKHGEPANPLGCCHPEPDFPAASIADHHQRCQAWRCDGPGCHVDVGKTVHCNAAQCPAGHTRYHVLSPSGATCASAEVCETSRVGSVLRAQGTFHGCRPSLHPLAFLCNATACIERVSIAETHSLFGKPFRRMCS